MNKTDKQPVTDSRTVASCPDCGNTRRLYPEGYECAYCNLKPVTVKWDKVPSVTSGGKPYFWNTIGRYENRRTVVWDRFCKCWVVKGPQTMEHKYGKAYMTFDTDKEARAYVEAGKAI